MTQSELNKLRNYVPFAIFGFCVLPWFLVRYKTLADVKLVNELIVPVLAVILAFLYVGLDVRRPFWKREIESHVGKQIQRGVLDMVPDDLALREEERQELLRREVFRDLTGVFWEAVDQSPILRSHKEHFYSNGIVYSTSIDVYLICSLAGLAYGVASLATGEHNLAYVAVAAIAMALVSRLFVTPQRRRIHLALSAEQLDLLRREQSDFVSNRFREIITGWRSRP